MMQRRMRLEVVEAIYGEQELPKDSINLEQNGYLATVTEKQVGSTF